MAVFTIIYSVITLGLLRIANRQLDNARKEQRPWIVVHTGRGQPKSGWPEKSSPVEFLLHVINTGKTPAKNLHAAFFIESVKNGNHPLFNKSSSLAQTGTGVLYPNIPTDDPVFYTFLQSDWDDLREGGSFVIIYGRASYTDVFQRQHWTDFCEFTAMVSGGYTSQSCTEYSNTDNN